MEIYIYSRANPGIFTAYDAVGLDCHCQEDAEQDQERQQGNRTGGIVRLAQGGCVVAECLLCGRHWALNGLKTQEYGPLPPELSNPQAG